jgi:hypothetical protein
VAEAPVGVGVPVAHEVEVEVLRVPDVHVRQQPPVSVARLGRLEPQGDGLTRGAAGDIAARFVRPEVGAGAVVTGMQLRRIHPEQAHARLGPSAGGRPDRDRVTIGDVGHHKRLLVERAPVVPRVTEDPNTVEHRRQRQQQQPGEAEPPQVPPAPQPRVDRIEPTSAQLPRHGVSIT